MKKAYTLFLKLSILIIGVGTIAALLFFPTVEGRNVDSTLAEVYLNDPFLWFVYIGSIPFFVALYQAFRFVIYIENDKSFSKLAVSAVKKIRYATLSLIGFIAIAEVLILLNEEEDKAGGIAMGIYLAFVSIIIAAGTTVLQKFLESGEKLKSENDLTV